MRIILHYDKLRGAKLGAWRAFLYLYGHESNLLSMKEQNKLKMEKETFLRMWRRVIEQMEPGWIKGKVNLHAEALSEFMYRLVFQFTNVPEALSHEEADQSGAVKTVDELLKSPQTDP